jgi:hypothetical protein
MGEGHIFLSYTSADKYFADDLVRGLESHGLQIWYAPRDVRPGDYPEQIQRAIETAKAFVVIVSEASNQSNFVRAETEMAFSRRRPVFPVRYAPIAPASGLALFLQLTHWTDAFGPTRQTALSRLAGELARLSRRRGGGQSLFRRQRPAGEDEAAGASRLRSRAVLPLMVVGCGALILFVLLLVQGDGRSGAGARAADANLVANGQTGPAGAAPGQPNYDPLVESWQRYVIETMPPPPPEDNLFIDNGASAGTGTGNDAAPDSNVSGM